jgi:hypothetical protein
MENISLAKSHHWMQGFTFSVQEGVGALLRADAENQSISVIVGSELSEEEACTRYAETQTDQESNDVIEIDHPG